MKPINDPRHELLEDLFSPSENEETFPIEKVLGIIRQEKQTCHRRRRAMMPAACGLALVAAVFGVWNSRPQELGRSLVQVSARPIAPFQADFPVVERVSDQGALDLLDSTPSAVIEWPDGRRTLMVLVSARR